MSAFQAVRVREHTKHVLFLEGRGGAGDESTRSDFAGHGQEDHLVGLPSRCLLPMRTPVVLAKLALISCLSLTFTTLQSCGASRGEIAVIPRTTSTTIWEAEHAGAEFAARRFGLRIRWNAPTREDDVQLQIGLVDRAIEQRYRGLIVTPDEPRALMVPIRRAIAAGVPTIVVGSALSLPPQRNLSYIVNDDEIIGRMGATRIGEVLHGKGEVAVLGIDPQSLSSLAVLGSFVSVLEELFPNISVVDRRAATNNDLDSEFVANQVLLSHPHVNVIFALDSTGTLGAYLALKSRDLTNRVKVVGVQQSVELANAIRLHQVDSIIAENTYEMGYRAVEALALGQAKTSGLVKLAPMLITAENVDSPAARPFITNDWMAEQQ
jgi:ribose transport system substrate-binding protein